jgi:hypothetical protein
VRSLEAQLVGLPEQVDEFREPRGAIHLRHLLVEEDVGDGAEFEEH